MDIVFKTGGLHQFLQATYIYIYKSGKFLVGEASLVGVSGSGAVVWACNVK